VLVFDQRVNIAAREDISEGAFVDVVDAEIGA
jgi:hypothetical protein